MINTQLLTHLVNGNLLDSNNAKKIAELTRKEHIPVVSYLTQSQLIQSHILLSFCAEYFCLPVHTLDFAKKPMPHPLLTEDFVYKNRMVIIDISAYLSLAMSDPSDVPLFKKITFELELPIIIYLVDDMELEKYLQLYYPSDKLQKQLNQTLALLPDKLTLQTESNNNPDEPVTNFVTELLRDAAQKEISDIHLEPKEQDCLIRFRRDGMLSVAATIPLHMAARVITRLKIMANLNIAERRLPQDGRIKQATHLDIRVNSCPTFYGEKLVLRLLNAANMQHDLTQLGLSQLQLELFYSALAKPQGLILITGPTGSGKTVTLYSALTHLNNTVKNIVTIEDPVEILLPGINQTNIHPEIGLSFAAILQNVLRQDPDVIMVGEIRDLETANTALQAAQTGHLVLSTLHTNSANEAYTRLQAMGVATHLLTSNINLILAQRLIRKRCQLCKQGCEHCLHGYKGRTGIFETLGSDARLYDMGMEKVKAGMTSYAEILRVAPNH